MWPFSCMDVSECGSWRRHQGSLTGPRAHFDKERVDG